MATINPRINVTLGVEALDVLSRLADRDNMSLSAKAAEMIQVALEMREDYYFSKLADKRAETATKYYTHEEAWK